MTIGGDQRSASAVGGAASPMAHVRVVLALGTASAVALDAWDVAVGGVTIEGPAGDVSNSIEDAPVVVSGGSRAVANTADSGARAASSNCLQRQNRGLVTGL